MTIPDESTSTPDVPVETGKKESVTEVAEKPVISKKEILAAATNDATLSDEEFMLGEDKYKVVHLGYDDYISFMARLEPFMGAMFSSFTSKLSKATPALEGLPDIPIGESLDASSLVLFCGSDLPEMVCLICQQTKPGITVAEIKEKGKTPFNLAAIVIKQIAVNRMIQDFADFFVQMTPLLGMGSQTEAETATE